ncbi:ABC-type amino acid transport system, permease protein [Candidatus Phytoplasma solani]|uniref:amino acid ABC transporter permease n=1 Tax=Candidatus Phytoplasma solani TaxID=69896 RepID=UPI0032DAFDAC
MQLLKLCYNNLKNHYSIYYQGLMTTVKLAVFGTVGAFLLALLLLYVKGLPKKPKKTSIFTKISFKSLNAIINAYIFIIKGVPMMLQAMLFYYGLKSTGYFKWLTPFYGGLIVITFNSTAYIAEIMLKNMQFFDPGQIEAALALGMTARQALKRVVLPQVIQRSLLRIVNEFIINVKDSCVFSTIGLLELFGATKQIYSISYSVTVPFINASIMYLMLVGIATIVLKKLEIKLGNKNA